MESIKQTSIVIFGLKLYDRTKEAQQLYFWNKLRDKNINGHVQDVICPATLPQIEQLGVKVGKVKTATVVTFSTDACAVEFLQAYQGKYEMLMCGKQGQEVQSSHEYPGSYNSSFSSTMSDSEPTGKRNPEAMPNQNQGAAGSQNAGYNQGATWNQSQNAGATSSQFHESILSQNQGGTRSQNSGAMAVQNPGARGSQKFGATESQNLEARESQNLGATGSYPDTTGGQFMQPEHHHKEGAESRDAMANEHTTPAMSSENMEKIRRQKWSSSLAIPQKSGHGVEQVSVTNLSRSFSPSNPIPPFDLSDSKLLYSQSTASTRASSAQSSSSFPPLAQQPKPSYAQSSDSSNRPKHPSRAVASAVDTSPSLSNPRSRPLSSSTNEPDALLQQKEEASAYTSERVFSPVEPSPSPSHLHSHPHSSATEPDAAVRHHKEEASAYTSEGVLSSVDPSPEDRSPSPSLPPSATTKEPDALVRHHKEETDPLSATPSPNSQPTSDDGDISKLAEDIPTSDEASTSQCSFVVFTSFTDTKLRTWLKKELAHHGGSGSITALMTAKAQDLGIEEKDGNCFVVTFTDRRTTRTMRELLRSQRHIVEDLPEQFFGRTTIEVNTRLFEKVGKEMDVKKLSNTFSLKINDYNNGIIKCEGDWLNVRLFESYVKEKLAKDEKKKEGMKEKYEEKMQMERQQEKWEEERGRQAEGNEGPPIGRGDGPIGRGEGPSEREGQIEREERPMGREERFVAQVQEGGRSEKQGQFGQSRGQEAFGQSRGQEGIERRNMKHAGELAHGRGQEGVGQRGERGNPKDVRRRENKVGRQHEGELGLRSGQAEDQKGSQEEAGKQGGLEKEPRRQANYSNQIGVGDHLEEGELKGPTNPEIQSTQTAGNSAPLLRLKMPDQKSSRTSVSSPEDDNEPFHDAPEEPLPNTPDAQDAPRGANTPNAPKLKASNETSALRGPNTQHKANTSDKYGKSGTDRGAGRVSDGEDTASSKTRQEPNYLATDPQGMGDNIPDGMYDVHTGSGASYCRRSPDLKREEDGQRSSTPGGRPDRKNAKGEARETRHDGNDGQSQGDEDRQERKDERSQGDGDGHERKDGRSQGDGDGHERKDVRSQGDGDGHERKDGRSQGDGDGHERKDGRSQGDGDGHERKDGRSQRDKDGHERKGNRSQRDEDRHDRSNARAADSRDDSESDGASEMNEDHTDRFKPHEKGPRDKIQSAREKTPDVREKTQFGKGREQERRETPKDAPPAGHSKDTPSLFYKQELKAPPVVCLCLEKDTKAIETIKGRYNVKILFSHGVINISGDDQNSLKKAEQRLKEEVTQIQESMEMNESDVIPKDLREEVKRMIQNQAESITCIINEESERVNALGDSAEEFIREVNMMVRSKMQEAASRPGYRSLQEVRRELKKSEVTLQVSLDVLKYLSGCRHALRTIDFGDIGMNMNPDGEMGIITLSGANEKKVHALGLKLNEKIEEIRISKDFVELPTPDAIDVHQLLKEFPDVYVDLKGEFLMVELLGPRDSVKIVKQVIISMLKGRSTMSEGSRSYSQVVSQSTGVSSSDWPTPTSRSTPTPTPSFAEPMSFQTTTGRSVFVHVLVQDITRMQVDVIVNAANEHLDHGGGVAWAIARAAGKELEDDCKAYIKKYKPIKVTNHFISKAGQLPCGKVMHVVGPRWNKKEKDQEKRMQQLRETFHKCLTAANDNNYVSIAIPPVSAGIFGFPSYTVAMILAKYVGEFVHKPKRKLTDIYIVDISTELITMIQKQMAQQTTLRRCEKFKGESACLPSIGHAGQGGPRRRHRVLDTSGEAGGGSSFGSSTSTTAPSSPRAGGMDRGMDPTFSSGHLPHEASAKEVDEGSSVDPPPSSKDKEEKKEKKEEEEKEDCPICLDSIDDLKTLDKCSHKFCKECIEECFKTKPVCPICGVVYGEITGNQPKNGQMKDHVTSINLPGYEKCGTIAIEYHFNGGIQGPEHHNPGRPYSGTSRRAYLPDNPEGRKVLRLLKKAFKRRLIFTIGTSVTSGVQDTVTWNDIHHKTNITGRAERYGYPDDKYLSRVTEELAAKGVTE